MPTTSDGWCSTDGHSGARPGYCNGRAVDFAWAARDGVLATWAATEPDRKGREQLVEERRIWEREAAAGADCWGMSQSLAAASGSDMQKCVACGHPPSYGSYSYDLWRGTAGSTHRCDICCEACWPAYRDREKRAAPDGTLYNEAEFQRHLGDADGTLWRAAAPPSADVLYTWVWRARERFGWRIHPAGEWQVLWPLEDGLAGRHRNGAHGAPLPRHRMGALGLQAVRRAQQLRSRAWDPRAGPSVFAPAARSDVGRTPGGDRAAGAHGVRLFGRIA